MNNVRRTDIKPLQSLRRAIGVTELIVALMILGTLATLLVPMLARITTLEQEMHRREIAQQIALNVIEFLRADPDLMTQSEAWNQSELFPERFEVAVEAAEIDPRGLQPVRITVTSLQHPTMKPVQFQTWLPGDMQAGGGEANE